MEDTISVQWCLENASVFSITLIPGVKYLEHAVAVDQ